MWIMETPQAFTCDDDGNLLRDGQYVYSWDGENRLVGVSNENTQIRYTYDHMGRRIRRTSTSGTTNTYVYDGWNPVADICATANGVSTNVYVWGLDLSGTLQGAGGIGGLLAIVEDGERHLVALDGNGNVVNLVDAATGQVSATYEYGPFGEVLRATGPEAEGNPWRFSTRCSGMDAGLLLYPKRVYSPTLGRFLSRDPIEEYGGTHLYGYVGNDPVNDIDPLGLEGLEESGTLGWLGNQLTVPIRVPLGFVGSILSGDVFSRDSDIPVYDSDQCEYLITVTGIKMADRESQIRFMRQIAGLNMFKGIRNPAWVNNPSRFWGIGDAVQILVNETMYAITVPDLRTVRKIEAAARAAEQNGCQCWCITVVAHSQGTMLVKRALDVLDPKTKEHMSIIGLGGETTFGRGDGVAFARNIAHVNDPVPRKWNRGSFWNGNDTMISLGYKNPSDAPEGAPAYDTAQGSLFNYDAHSWDNVYIPYLREHSLDVPRCQPVK